MELNLRPMSTSQVLDRTFHIYRNNFVLLAGTGALLPLLLLIMQLAFIPLGFPPNPNTMQQSPGVVGVMFLGYFCCYGVIYLLGGSLTIGATVFVVSKLHLGESSSIGQSYKQVFSRFWRVLGVIVLQGMIVFGCLIVGEVIAIIVFGVSAGATRVLGKGGFTSVGMIVAILWGVIIFLAALLAALLLYSKLSLSIPACLLEHLPVGSSLSRSWSLTKNSVWRLILIYLLTWTLGVVLALVLNIPGQVYTSVMHGKAPLPGLIAQHLGAFIAGVIANPIATIAIALVYYDQRVRKEAFDLELMMDAMGQPAQVEAATAPPPMIG